MSKKENSQEALNEEELTMAESFSSTVEEKRTATSEPSDADTPEVAQLKVQLAEMEDRYLRTAAEFDNYRKRSVRQGEEFVIAAESRIFGDVLEIVDNFKRALENSDNQKDFESFKKGMKLIYEQMKSFLNKHKIEEIEAVGKKFDPDFHEAIMQIESDEHPEGVVAAEMAAGFKKGDKVVRHSKVGVSTGQSKKGK